MRKKYLISILTLSALMISTLVWDSIKLPFDYQNSMYGEYEKQNYNPNNDTLRFIFFVLIPLMTFFVCYLKFNKENLFTVNQVLNAKVLNQTKIDSVHWHAPHFSQCNRWSNPLTESQSVQTDDQCAQSEKDRGSTNTFFVVM